MDYSGITYNRLGLNVEVKIPSERESSNKIKTRYLSNESEDTLLLQYRSG